MSVMGMDASLIDKNNKPTDFYNDLLKELKDKEPEDGWALIIFDPISRFLGPKAETENEAATQFIALLERMSLELKGEPTILFGHHMNKSGLSGETTDQGSARGASAITDGVRWQANLEKVAEKEGKKKYKANEIKLNLVKSNHTKLLEETLIRDDFGNLMVDDGNTKQ